MLVISYHSDDSHFVHVLSYFAPESVSVHKPHRGAGVNILYRMANKCTLLWVERVVCREVQLVRMDNGILAVEVEHTCRYDC